MSAGRRRRFVDAPDAERCCAPITLADGSRARCGRRAGRFFLCCSQHYVMLCRGKLSPRASLEIAAVATRDLEQRIARLDSKRADLAHPDVMRLMFDMNHSIARLRGTLLDLGA